MQALGVPKTLLVLVILGYVPLIFLAVRPTPRAPWQKPRTQRPAYASALRAVAASYALFVVGNVLAWSIFYTQLMSTLSGAFVLRALGQLVTSAPLLALALLLPLIGDLGAAWFSRKKPGPHGGWLAASTAITVALDILAPLCAALLPRLQPWSIVVPALLGVLPRIVTIGILLFTPDWFPWWVFGWIRSVLRWLQVGIGAAAGIAFLALVRVANALPVTRGSHVIMRHEIIRASALLSGVVFLVFVIGALLPLVLNAMERAGFARFVGARHIRATKSGFLSTIAVLSILGVAFSSCALGSVISIMGGFGADLKRKILANNAHVVVDSPTPQGFGEWEPVLERVKQAPGVVAATPMITSEVMASVGSNMSGVLIRGIDVKTVGDVIDLPKNVELGKLEWLQDPELVAALPWSERKGVEPDENVFRVEDPKKPPEKLVFLQEKHEPPDPAVEKAARPQVPPDRPVYPCIVIGRELAKTLHLRLGSEVALVSRMGELTPAGVIPRERKFRVAGIFFSGMYEYDATHGYITIEAARDFFDQPDRIGAIQVKVVDSERAELFRDGIVAAAARPDELRIRDWKEINKNLFSALKLERIATFIVLSLSIIVASFCILCTLLLMVTEKGREIAILKALGASDMAILRIFMVEGMIIGGIGTVFGVATGYAVCYGLSWFGVRIDPDVYYIDRLPIAVNAWDFAAVTGAALVICAVSTLYPARAASKLLPVEGLRYE